MNHLNDTNHSIQQSECTDIRLKRQTIMLRHLYFTCIPRIARHKIQVVPYRVLSRCSQMADLSGASTPASHASSSSSVAAAGFAVEPMDLTDFIGSLNDSNEGQTANVCSADRRASMGSSRESDLKASERERKKLLDLDFDYSKLCKCFPSRSV